MANKMAKMKKIVEKKYFFNIKNKSQKMSEKIRHLFFPQKNIEEKKNLKNCPQDAL